MFGLTVFDTPSSSNGMIATFATWSALVRSLFRIRTVILRPNHLPPSFPPLRVIIGPSAAADFLSSRPYSSLTSRYVQGPNFFFPNKISRLSSMAPFSVKWRGGGPAVLYEFLFLIYPKIPNQISLLQPAGYENQRPPFPISKMKCKKKKKNSFRIFLIDQFFSLNLFPKF